MKKYWQSVMQVYPVINLGYLINKRDSFHEYNLLDGLFK